MSFSELKRKNDVVHRRLPFSFTRTGKTGRAWWISHALELDDGQVSVARIDAKDKDGQSFMLELTEDMLEEYGLVPEHLKFPLVVDGERPKTNQRK